MPDQPCGQRCSRSRIAEYLPNHMQRTITWLGGGNWGKRVATLATGAKVVQNSFVGLVEKLSYSSGQIKSRAVARRESLLRQVKMFMFLRQDFFERNIFYESILRKIPWNHCKRWIRHLNLFREIELIGTICTGNISQEICQVVFNVMIPTFHLKIPTKQLKTVGVRWPRSPLRVYSWK